VSKSDSTVEAVVTASENQALQPNWEDLHRYWSPHKYWHQPISRTIVVGLSRLFLRVFNKLNIEGKERFDALFDRGDRGLLTFGNHVSIIDDPSLFVLFGVIRWQDTRWVGADERNFFSNFVKGRIFTDGKGVPLVRGGGVGQRAMDFLSERLQAGEWIHLFPEGGRTRDPKVRLRSPFKLGIGRLIAEAKPIVLPFYHYGMHQILPVGARLPRVGHSVRLRFGEAVDTAAAHPEWFERPSDESLWREIADWSQGVLRNLELAVHPDPGEE
jgi:monolysocardiolipin acyltransferase